MTKWIRLSFIGETPDPIDIVSYVTDTMEIIFEKYLDIIGSDSFGLRLSLVTGTGILLKDTPLSLGLKNKDKILVKPRSYGNPCHH